MQRPRSLSRVLPLLTLLLSLSVASAGTGHREGWIIGKWTSRVNESVSPRERTVVFHRDHSWGVEHAGAPRADGSLTIYEDVRGRRWHIRGDRLIMRAPSDDGFQTYAEKIVYFSRDKIVTDVFTYTREK